MNPVVVLLVKVFLEQGFDAFVKFRALLTKKDLPTEAEWAEIDAILQKTGRSYFEGAGK